LQEPQAMLSKLAVGAARVQPSRSGLGARLTDLVVKVEAMLETYRQRRALLALSDHMLRDLGLSRADAYREATRSFWDLPA
jgi:uncharacterized protein YjiS (DUF1127 family)